MTIASSFLVRLQGYDLSALRGCPQNEYNLASATGWILVFYFIIQSIVMYHFFNTFFGMDSYNVVFAAMFIAGLLTLFDVVLGSGYVSSSRLLLRMPLAFLVATFGSMVLMAHMFKEDINKFVSSEALTILNKANKDIDDGRERILKNYQKMIDERINQITKPNLMEQELTNLGAQITQLNDTISGIEAQIKNDRDIMTREIRTGAGKNFRNAENQVKQNEQKNKELRSQLDNLIKTKDSMIKSVVESQNKHAQAVDDATRDLILKRDSEIKDLDTKRRNIENNESNYSGLATKIKALWDIAFSPLKYGFGASLAVIVVYFMLVFMELGYVIAKYITSRQMPAYWSLKTFEKQSIIKSNKPMR